MNQKVKLPIIWDVMTLMWGHYNQCGVLTHSRAEIPNISGVELKQCHGHADNKDHKVRHTQVHQVPVRRCAHVAVACHYHRHQDIAPYPHQKHDGVEHSHCDIDVCQGIAWNFHGFTNIVLSQHSFKDAGIVWRQVNPVAIFSGWNGHSTLDDTLRGWFPSFNQQFHTG